MVKVLNIELHVFVGEQDLGQTDPNEKYLVGERTQRERTMSRGGERTSCFRPPPPPQQFQKVIFL